jgi:hypothetical protein
MNNLSKIRERAKACHRALVELETRAGIAEAAEKLRAEPAWYAGIYDAAEPYSDEQQKLVVAEESFHQERLNRRLRDLYFSVHDLELRKTLIAKDREGGSLALSYWHQELSDAAAGLDASRSAHGHWWVWASVWGIVFIALGFNFFSLIGALGGLLVGFFNGWRMEHEAVGARARAVADAECKMKEAERIWNEVRNEPQLFSQREAATGQPNSEGRLRAV